MNDRPVRVLIVDDSRVARAFLTNILESDPHIRVVGAVADGETALDFVRKATPDVVLMDIHMPRMDGFEATRRIMETHPVPIVICSGTMHPTEVIGTFRLMEAGAVACLEKPVGRDHAKHDAMAADLRQTVKLMAEVRVVRRWARPRTAPSSPIPAASIRRPASDQVRLIGIGASTGGPPAVQTILAALPKDFPVPILVVQHISPGFLPGLVEWLSQTTGFQVQIASYGVEPLRGHVYLAPDDFHMVVNATGRIVLMKEAPENGLRPSVARLFRSMAIECGPHAIGVLLTGMGRDGAAELKLMRDRGSLTIAQDVESSVVHGMPGAAIALGGAAQVLPPDAIASTIVEVVTDRNRISRS